MRTKPFTALVAIGAAATLAAPAWAGVTQSSPARAGSYLTPTTVSSDCSRGRRQSSACRVVSEFFRAMNSQRYTDACALLGERLRSETHGMPCRRFLALGMPEAMPWGILEAHSAGRGVSVLVALGVSELDHVRMLRHRAFVAPEGRTLRILTTRVVF
jgi:hypothetical protein